jgi:PPM family protein phosphatase
MRTSLDADPQETTSPRTGAAVPRPQPASASPALTLTSFGLTDMGRQRSRNEDRFLIASPVSALFMERDRRHAAEMGYAETAGDVFAVADGVGGHPGGGVASTIAIETMSTFLLSTLKWVFALGGPEAIGTDMLAQIRHVLQWADAGVHEEASRNPQLQEMGTTLTMAYRHGPFLYVGHAGDSRCYILRSRTLHQITRDHTLVDELVREGLVSREDAARHVARHVITNALGPLTEGLHVDVHRVRLQPGDIVLLCTDGLSGVEDEASIAAILESAATPEKACERLIQCANDSGGPDNVTAIVAHVEAAKSQPAPARRKRPSLA